MPKIPEDPTSRFLEYYGDYLSAKRQKDPQMTWLSAVACRRELQKMGDPAKEAKYCQQIFEPFVGKKQAEQIYRDLCDDSRSYPLKAIDVPGCLPISPVWDLETGETSRILQGHAGWGRCRGSHIRRSLVGFPGLGDNILETGKTVRTLQGPGGPIATVAVTPDGRHVASGSDDKTLRLSDLETGKTTKTFHGHAGVAVTPTVATWSPTPGIARCGFGI